MFRILNADLEPNVRTVAGLAKPQVLFLELSPEVKIAYDCNSMVAVHVGDKLWKMMQEKDEEQTFDGLLYSTRKPMFNHYMPNRLSMIVCEATHACNLKCRYCFVAHYYPDQKFNPLTVETVKKAVNQLIGPWANLDIGFFGGEPLMAWKNVLEIMLWAEEEQTRRHNAWGNRKDRPAPKPKFHITTNATLLTADIAKEIQKRNCSLIVSLDGNEMAHNNMRPAKAPGINSHQCTLRGLQIFMDHGLGNRITLRSSYTGEGLNLMERITFLNDLMYKGYAGHVSIEPISLSESACTMVPEEKGLAIPEDPEQLSVLYSEEYRRASNWYIEEIKAGRHPSMHHFDTGIRRILWTQHSPSECGAGKGYGAIAPDGTVYACHREHGTEIGHVDKGGVDEEKRAKWIENRLYSRNGCMECPVRYWCGSGCRCNSVLKYDDVNKPDITECWFKNLFFRENLWIMANLSREQLVGHVPNPKQRRRR